MKLRIISNLYGLDKVSQNRILIEFLLYPSKININFLFNFLWRYRDYDYFIFNGSGRDLFFIMIFKFFIPFAKLKIISLDLLLPIPRNFADHFRILFRRVLLSKIHLFFLYYKNTEGIQKLYKLPSRKFRYIPFKVNRYYEVLNKNTEDLGYVFCGGKTRRDFNVLIEAVRGLKIPVRIVTMDNRYISEHGSYLDERQLPENVNIVKLNGNFDQFLDQMANSRFVVLPLIPHICGTGIGVYIMAMALKKCVVISSNVSVDEILNDTLAVIVPPADPVALKNAIEKTYYNNNFRNLLANNGYEYAIKLGDENTLNQTIINVIIDDYLEI